MRCFSSSGGMVYCSAASMQAMTARAEEDRATRRESAARRWCSYSRDCPSVSRKIEIPAGVDERLHPEKGEIIGKALSLGFVGRNDQRTAAEVGAQGGDEMGLVNARKPGRRAGKSAGLHGGAQERYSGRACKMRVEIHGSSKVSDGFGSE